MQGNANIKKDAINLRAKGVNSHTNKKGFALVLVLISLVLLCVMVVGYFSMATGQRKSTAVFRRSNDVQELARLGVDAVIAQIRDATTQNATTWASQPGAIRTYGINATYSALNASGSRPDTIYKLYSSADMTVSGNSFNASIEVPPQNWDTQPGIYVDLNAPAISTSANGSQKLNFPIIDPRAFTTSNSTSVQGFSYNSSVNGTILPSSGSGDDSQRLPMPTRWLYVLQDGQMINPTSQSGNIVTVPGASKTNPIVGRVAFWADDETAKININTAGGDIWEAPTDPYYAGSYWSPPYAHSEFDQKKLAMAQPYQREYQRYPGHPGTIHLSAVFPNLSLEEIMRLTPRYRFGGSKGGTVDLQTASSAITPKQDRLYASVDELIYDPSRNESSTINADRLERARFFLTTNSRASDLNLFGLPKVSAWPIHRRTGSQYRTPFDESIAFCTTANGHEYFFTRNQANDPQGDFNTRNGQLYDYLGNLLGRKVPGFGGNGTLADKWTSPERWQILTQIYDYIRSTNLKDTSTDTILPYAMEQPSYDPTPESIGFGQVIPTRITRNGVDTSGFGRFPVISEIGFMMIRCDPPSGVTPSPQLPSLSSNSITSASYRAWYQAIILVELTCAAQGFDVLGLNFNLEFNGLDNFKIKLVNPDTFLSAARRYGSSINATLDGSPPNTLVSLGFPSTLNLQLQQYSGRGFNARGWGGTLSPHALLVDSSGNTKILDNTLSGPNAYQLISNKFYVDFPGDLLDRFHGNNSTTINSRGVLREDPNLTKVGSGQVTPLQIAIPSWNFLVKQYAGNNNQYQITYNFNMEEINSIPLPSLITSNNSTTISIHSEPNRKTQEYTTKFDGDASSSYFVVSGNDLVRSLEPKFGNGTVLNRHPFGDTRHYIVNGSTIPSNWYEISSNWTSNSSANRGTQQSFQSADCNTWWSGGQIATQALVDTAYFLVSGTTGFGGSISGTPQPNLSTRFGKLKSGVWERDETVWPNSKIGVQNYLGYPGDWDSGISLMNDGPYINKPDDGTIDRDNSHAIYKEPYFRHGNYTKFTKNYFSPNRLLPSSVMFGSLPSAVKRQRPWETLLFNPGPAAGSNHPSLISGAPDHILLDLFTIPLVDPYAISEPFSTSGRINLNTQILPFKYINRDTSLLGTFKGIRVPVISADDLGKTIPNYYRTDPFLYKMPSASFAAASTSVNEYIYHRPVDLITTIEGFRSRMQADNLFRSNTEICDMFLVPDLRNGGEHFLNSGLANPAPAINTGIYDPASLRNFWTAAGSGLKWSGLTGDNLRERPYALLYPLVTTKSNSYTVHVIAQTLQNSPQAADDQFIERDGSVTGEWQGSYLIERQLAQNEPGLIDYTQNSNPGPQNHPEHLHKIRVLQIRRFNPGT